MRKLEPSDLPYLYLWENDADSWPEGSNHNPLSQADLRDYIASTTGDIFRDRQLRLIISQSSALSVLSAPSELSQPSSPSEPSEPSQLTLGCVDLFDFDPRNRKAAVGIYIAPDYRGHGVGKQALALLSNLAFRQLGLRMIYAFVSESNSASMSLFRASGFTPSASIPSWTLESSATLWQKFPD